MPYEPGVLRAVGKRRDGDGGLRGEVRTAGAPAAIRLTADRDTITAAPGDVAHVRFEIVDSAGTVVPTADNLVHIAVTGGDLLALDNADLQDHDPYRTDRGTHSTAAGWPSCGRHSLGCSRVTASADGLRAASVQRAGWCRGAAAPTVPAAR